MSDWNIAVLTSNPSLFSMNIELARVICLLFQQKKNTCFLIINAAIASLLFPLCEGIKIPRIWALVIHPLAIATMSVLLGGAIGFL